MEDEVQIFSSQKKVDPTRHSGILKLAEGMFTDISSPLFTGPDISGAEETGRHPRYFPYIGRRLDVIKVRLDLRAPERFVSWEYKSDTDIEPDVGSVMQVNRHRFKVLECTYLETHPRTLVIKGELS